MEEKMKFDALPEVLEGRVKETMGLSEEPKLVLRADIRPDGTYGDAWLVVTDRAFITVSPDHKDEVTVTRTPLASVHGVYIHSFVGNSIVELRTDDGSVEAARYTRALADKFAEALPEFRSLVREEVKRIEEMPGRRRRGRVEERGTDEETVRVEDSQSVVVPGVGLMGDEVDEGETGERRRADRRGLESEGPPIPRKVRCEECGRALPEGVDRCPYCTPKAALFLRSLTFIKPYWPWALLLLVLTGASSGLVVLPYKFQRHMIDDGILAEPPNWDALLRNWGFWIAALLASQLFNGVRNFIGPWLGQRVILYLRGTVYRHLQQLALSFYERRTTGNLLQRVTSDTDRLQEFLSTWLPEFMHAVLLILIVGVWLFALNWFLALVSLISIPIMAVLTFVLMRWIRRVYHKMWRYWASLSSLLSDAIPGVTVVRAFAQEEREIGRFDRRSQAFYDQSVRAIKVHAFYHPAVELLIMAGAMVVWLLGGSMVIKTRLAGEGAMTYGMLYVFVALLFRFYFPVRTLTMLSRTMQRAITSADRVFEILDTEPTIKNVEHPVVKVPLEGKVEFRNVWFRYEEGEPVLKDISFSAKAGQMIGLAGPSGAGKTTLVNLIARFYEVASGEILVDGVSMKELEIKSYRDQIGMVLQDPFLFNGTIGMNIGYGKMGATQEEVILSARAANAHDFIMELPDAYDTEVGERGVRLSGGERQRISIARAILKNPRILILDEATSSVDTETEAKIQEALERLVENRTTFAIAHRLSTLKRADRLLILEDGKLVEEGTHEELMDKDGTYARMCKLQAEISRVRAI